MTRKSPFVVFALPRSRTAWLSHFLSYGDNLVGHDIGIECQSIDDFMVPFVNGMIGTVETGAMIAWPQIRKLIPNVRFAVIKRPIWQVLHSLGRFGLEPSVEELIVRDNLLDEISGLKDTLTVSYESLNSESGCKPVFEFCLGERFDHGWWDVLREINIQVKIPETILRVQQNASALDTLKAQIRDANFKCSGSA